MILSRRRADPSRIAACVAAAVLHGAGLLALMLALAPGAARRTADSVMTAIDVAPPPPARPPKAPPRTKPAAPAGSAPPARAAPQALAPPNTDAPSAPTIADAPPGDATGAATGTATGAGADGAGNGTGGGQRFVQIAGDINSARDYPVASRALRLGHAVLITFTIGTDGRVHDCQVREPSPDPAADAITCQLATERFRFRPALDAAGHPVEAFYGWRQRWFP